MKAEHRKELQTNALADRLGRMLQGMKSRPQAAPVIFWVVAGLLVVGIVGTIWYLRARSSTRYSQALAAVDDTTDLEELQKIAADNKHSLPGRLALLKIARTHMQ